MNQESNLGSEHNPENKCSHLFQDAKLENPLHEMFEMQLSLQRKYFKLGKGLDYDNATFKERVNEITVQWRNFTTEMTELLERLPFKEWKTYTPEQLAGYVDEEHRLETEFEYIDAFHFFMNIGLLLDITPERFISLYVAKNQENFDRQARGY